VALGLVACRKAKPWSDATGPDKPIDVASVIAGCTDPDDCDRQCVAKHASSCVSAGRMYEFGRGAPADPSRAFRLYEQACDLSYAGGCYNAAVLLEAGNGVDRDSERARQLYAKVCEMGSKTACQRAETHKDGRKP
jgi:TPR repeat protein